MPRKRRKKKVKVKHQKVYDRITGRPIMYPAIILHDPLLLANAKKLDTQRRVNNYARKIAKRRGEPEPADFRTRPDGSARNNLGAVQYHMYGHITSGKRTPTGNVRNWINDQKGG